MFWEYRYMSGSFPSIIFRCFTLRIRLYAKLLNQSVADEGIGALITRTG